MLVKSIFSVLILPLMFLFSADHAEVSTSTPDYPGETTTTGIGFGKPNADCSGSGLCMVTSDFKTGLRDNFGVGKITIGRSGSVDRILFLRNSLTNRTIEKHLSGSHFLMEEPYEGKLKMGGKNIKIHIPAGKYRIKKTRNGFLLEVSG